VRFSCTDGAKLALEKASETVGGKIKVEDVEVNCSILGGEHICYTVFRWLSSLSFVEGEMRKLVRWIISLYDNF